MRFPSSVKVAGTRLRIVRKDLSAEEAFGSWDHDAKTISLDKGLTGELLLTTLRHEMLEASLSLSGIAWCEGPISVETEGVIRCLEEIFFPAWDPLFERLKT